MKNNTLLLYILLGVLGILTSCSSDDYSPYISALKVVKSDVDFSATGGNGQITVSNDAAIASVESSESWCNATLADANSANVTVERNQNSDGRHAIVTIKGVNGGEVHVAVSQSGVQLTLEGSKRFLFNYSPSRGAVKVETHSFDVDISTDDNSWISARMVGDSVLFTTEENNTNMYRGGYIYCSCGSRTDSILVMQAEKKDVYGEYEVIGDAIPEFDESYMATHLKLSLAPSDEEGKIKLIFPEVDATRSFGVNFNDSSLEFEYPAGLSLGTTYRHTAFQTGDFDCFTSVFGTNMQGSSTLDYSNSNHSMTAYMTFENGQIVWRFKDNHSWTGVTTNGIAVTIITGIRSYDSMAYLENPYMVIQ